MLHHRIIKPTGTHIFLAPDFSVPLKQTSFKDAKLIFSYHLDTYWLVEVEFTAASRSLKLKICDYNYLEGEEIFNKQAKKGEIRFIEIIEPDYDKILPILSSYCPSFIKTKSNNENGGYEFEASLSICNEEKYIPQSPNAYISEQTQLESTGPKRVNYHFPQRIYLNEEIAFKALTFDDGYCTASVYIDCLYKKVELRIYNSVIKKEYEPIKSYFQKMLKSKSLNIEGYIVFHKDRMVDSSLSSAVLDHITLDFLEEQELYRVSSIEDLTYIVEESRKIKSAQDIFTKLHAKDGASNLFFNTEEGLMTTLLKAKKGVRNKEQLKYLSEKQTTPFKLKFTLKPYFGFVFLIVGNTQNHYCWELLNSNATYIWSFDNSRSLNEQYDIIDSEISIIYEVKRPKYKAYKKATQEISTFTYNAINHAKIEVEENAFAIWKRHFDDIVV